MNKPKVREEEEWTAHQIELTRKEAHRIAEMVDVLPGVIFAPHTSELLCYAGMECFFGSVRTLIEFLLIKPTERAGDLTTRHTLCSSRSMWEPKYADPYLKGRLGGTWALASKHQAHFTISRPAELRFSEQDLRQIADEVLTVWDQFATASNHPDVPHRANFSMFR
jgi:hypothetical protein